MKPYRNVDELPQSLRNELPELAQRLYLAVYQRTWETCAIGNEGGGEGSEGEIAKTAHEAAMLAVQERFEKGDDGQWRQAPVSEEIHPDKLPPETDSE